jgi:hypothetical protein
MILTGELAVNPEIGSKAGAQVCWATVQAGGFPYNPFSSLPLIEPCMHRLVLLLSLLIAPVTLLAETFSSLEERMSQSEFKAAGLEKLSSAELQALNSWLRERSAEAATRSAAIAPAGIDQRGLRLPVADQDEIVSRIAGDFRGWSGRTRFTLENGQIWEGGGDSTLSVRLVDPVVRISQGTLGTWYLRVDGYNTTAKVKRIQ